MARNIAGAGIPLRVWNRTRSKAEPLADAALESARDGLSRGTVLLQQSTVGVEGSSRLAALADELGVVFVDAPVLGTKKPAEDGALVVLAAGRARPVRAGVRGDRVTHRARR